MANNSEKKFSVSPAAVADDSVGKELFRELKDVMEKEVEDMPHVATRREFLQKIAVSSFVVPTAILLMAADAEADFCCIAPCVQCITDCCIGLCVTCVFDSCNVLARNICPDGCLNCLEPVRAGCQAICQNNVVP